MLGWEPSAAGLSSFRSNSCTHNDIKPTTVKRVLPQRHYSAIRSNARESTDAIYS